MAERIFFRPTCNRREGRAWVVDGELIDRGTFVDIRWPDGTITERTEIITNDDDSGSYAAGYRYQTKVTVFGTEQYLLIRMNEVEMALVSDDGDSDLFKTAAVPLVYREEDAAFLVGDHVLKTGDVVDYIHDKRVMRFTLEVWKEQVGPRHAVRTVGNAKPRYFLDRAHLIRDRENLVPGRKIRLHQAAA